MKRSAFIGILLCAVLGTNAQLKEELDRGVVAVGLSGKQIHVSWRLLKEDPKETTFNLYRKEVGVTNDYIKINHSPIRQTTDYTDTDVKPGQCYHYRVHALNNDKEIPCKGEGYIFLLMNDNPYLQIQLNNPTATVKLAAVADLDGDGAYDYIIQTPNFSTDPWHGPGYWKRSLETYKLSAYSSKGKFMWEYDMGWAIETGTWYAPFVVYDLDGDGKAELYTKAGGGDTREMDGHVVEGKEYLVKIDGMTGKVVQRREWLSREGFDTYNHWSRNFLGIAYLDGVNPSLIMHRGTYTIIKTEAVDKSLATIWKWESTGANANCQGQGSHNLMVGDIDGDGKDELIPGTYALDHDGKTLWRTGLNHNDAGWLADIDPSRPGLEIFYGIENKSDKNGICLVEAATGKIIWGVDFPTHHVHSQGACGDFDPKNPGFEYYGGDCKGKNNDFYMYGAKGNLISRKYLGIISPSSVLWDADEQKEFVVNEKMFKFVGDTIRSVEGKIVFVGDILGDWREEMVTALPGELRIYSTNVPAINRKTCLMQDRMYRTGAAASASGYLFAPQLGLPPSEKNSSKK